MSTAAPARSCSSSTGSSGRNGSGPTWSTRWTTTTGRSVPTSSVTASLRAASGLTRLQRARRGHADLLDHLGIERVTLVGHSLGGGIAMQFFYLFPERVDRLVLVASGGLGREVNLVLRSATLPGAAQVLSVLASAPVLSRVEALGRGASKVGWRPGADIGAICAGSARSGTVRVVVPSSPPPVPSSTSAGRASAPTTTSRARCQSRR